MGTHVHVHMHTCVNVYTLSCTPGVESSDSFIDVVLGHTYSHTHTSTHSPTHLHTHLHAPHTPIHTHIHLPTPIQLITHTIHTPSHTYNPYFIFGVFLFGAGKNFKIHPAESFISQKKLRGMNRNRSGNPEVFGT